jgi:hypothetical protein
MSNQRPDVGNEIPNDLRVALVRFFSSWKFWSGFFTFLGGLFVFFAYRSYSELAELSNSYASLKGVPEDVRAAKTEAITARIEAAKLSGVPDRIDKLATATEAVRTELASVKSKTDSLEGLGTKATEISAKVTAAAKAVDDQESHAKAIEADIKRLSSDLKEISEKIADLKPAVPPSLKRLQLQLRLPEKETREEKTGYLVFGCDLPKLDYASMAIVEKIELRAAKSEAGLPAFIARAELSGDGSKLNVFVKSEKLADLRAAVSAGIEVSVLLAFQ